MEVERDLAVHRRRYRVLRHLNDHNNAHPFVSLEKAELIQELRMEEGPLEESVRFLEENMLLETVWFAGGEFWTKISQRGVDIVDIAEKFPDRGCAFFPPIKWFL